MRGHLQPIGSTSAAGADRRGGPATISDLATLDQAIAWRWLLRLEPVIELRLPELTSGDRERLQSDIDSKASVCGCAEGGIATAVALLGYLLAVSTGAWRPGVSTTAMIFIGLGVAMGAGMIGKFIGLLRARRGLRRTLMEARKLARGEPMRWRAAS